jgi:hypothetical protein
VKLWSIVAGAAVACVLAGCAPQDARNEARDVAARFLTAAENGDVSTACTLLAPRTREDLETADGPCANALPADELRGSVTAVDTWSDRAKVDTEQGSLFLAEFDDGWRVSAAGCASEEDAPYRCLVGG